MNNIKTTLSPTIQVHDCIATFRRKIAGLPGLRATTVDKHAFDLTSHWQGVEGPPSFPEHISFRKRVESLEKEVTEYSIACRLAILGLFRMPYQNFTTILTCFWSVM